jgi:hypothetical protein
MSELDGFGRDQQQFRSGSMLIRWFGKVTGRVCAAIVIGLLSPHLPGFAPPGINHQAEVCVVVSRT